MAAGWYGYPYPYGVYAPNPYNVTHLNRSFPEHHYPLENTRHHLSHGLHDAFAINTTVPSVKADVRETLHNYYIDVELPGIESKEQLKLKWTNSRTLFLEATKKRRDIPEDAETADKQTQHPVHELVSERHVGPLVRVFDFPVAVEREKLTAKLQYGLLAIVVPKAEDAKVEHKEVEVEHGPA